MTPLDPLEKKSNGFILCPVCKGSCRQEIGPNRRDPLEKFCQEEQKTLRKITMPEWYALVDKIFGVQGVRFP